jgi:hypothetical protein
MNDLLADSPSLKGLPRTLLENTKLYPEHIQPDAADDTRLNIFPAKCPRSIDLILDADFWPDSNPNS